MHTNRHSPQSEGGAFVGLDRDLGRNPAKQALRKTQVRLLIATPFSMQEVPLEHLPADAQAERDSQAESGASMDKSALEEERRALLTESPKRIAAAVKAALGTDVAPVVVVADPQVGGHFLK